MRDVEEDAMNAKSFSLDQQQQDESIYISARNKQETAILKQCRSRDG